MADWFWRKNKDCCLKMIPKLIFLDQFNARFTLAQIGIFVFTILHHFAVSVHGTHVLLRHRNVAN